MRVLSRALTLGVAFGLAVSLHAQKFDLVIAGGRVIDPESGLDGIRNIGISGRSIAAISAEPLTGRAAIDAPASSSHPASSIFTRTARHRRHIDSRPAMA